MEVAPEHDEQDGHVHVHFSEEQIEEHNSEIIVKNESEDRISLHLGFLQIYHHYEIKVTIQDKLNEDLNFDPLQNLNVKVTKVMPSEDGRGHDLTLDFSASREKLMKEEIILTDSINPERKITLEIHARVLGKGKGTPALKSGVHCTGIDPEYDSEQSDWQGFD